MTRYRFAIAASSGISLLAWSLPAAAQLEEVVVTAERRESSLQDVPVAITAYTADDLDRFQIDSVNDIDTFAPSLRVINNVASANALNVNIRGSTEAGGAFLFSEPGVGLYQDSIYRRMAAGNLQLADIERIEILRGPQGTLFGRNTLAGAINIVTKRPDPRQELSGSATLMYGNFDTYSARGSIYAPLSDTIAVSVAGYIREQNEGYFTDVVSGRDATKSDFQGFMTSLRARPSDELVIDASLYASKNDGDGQNGQPIFLGTAQNALARNDQVARGRAVRNGQVLETFSESDTIGGDLTIAYDFGDITVKSLTGYSKIDDAWAVDFTAGQFGSPNPAVRGIAGFFRDTAGDIKQLTQEFQLVGTLGATEVTGGLYYFNEETNQRITDTAAALAFLPGIGLEERYRLQTTSYAAYGQATWRFSERWALILGGRYTMDDKRLSGAKEASPFATSVTPFLSDEDFSRFTGRAGVEWKLSDQFLAYATFSQGYKSGTYDAGASALAITNVLNEELNDTFEIGTKAEFFGNLRLNAAAFLQDTSNLAIGQILPNGVVRQSNEGEVRILGLEFEGTWAPTERLVARLAFTLQDAEWQDVGNQPPTGILLSEAVAGVSDYVVTVGADYKIPVGAWGDLTLAADARIQSEFYTTSGHRDLPANLVETFTLANARAALTSADRKHQFVLASTNVLDEEAHYLTINFALNNTAVRYPINPRTIDFSYTYRF
ncbi:MAG: TonB-dependent receptor [Steroidobacteraceae bacterium]|jgi:iron complex outermembrane receptor protein|nr:TonB-dependent receptor [Steroidobacteraceae bacterium]